MDSPVLKIDNPSQFSLAVNEILVIPTVDSANKRIGTANVMIVPCVTYIGSSFCSLKEVNMFQNSVEHVVRTLLVSMI